MHYDLREEAIPFIVFKPLAFIPDEIKGYLKSIEDQIIIVTILGLSKTGKSSLLNTILDPRFGVT